MATNTVKDFILGGMMAQTDISCIIAILQRKNLSDADFEIELFAALYTAESQFSSNTSIKESTRKGYKSGIDRFTNQFPNFKSALS